MQDPSLQPSLENEPASRPGIRAFQGFCLGMLAWLAATSLGPGNLIRPLDWMYTFLVVGAFGAILFLVRARWVLWSFSGVVCSLILLLGCTPVMKVLVRPLIRTDPLQHCPAVVALSSDPRPDGSLDVAGQERVIKALELIRAGEANVLVITRVGPPFPSTAPAVRQMMAMDHIHAALEEVGPVQNTHDEGMAVARLAREKRWKRVLLVTSPLHSHRAAGVFQKAGLSVVVEPCEERLFTLRDLPSPVDRLAAFRQWLREVGGWYVYRARGWV